MVGCDIGIRLVIKRSLALTILVGLWWKERRIEWRILMMRWSPLHYVAYLSRQ
jgi:hypothetical protein